MKFVQLVCKVYLSPQVNSAGGGACSVGTHIIAILVKLVLPHVITTRLTDFRNLVFFSPSLPKRSNFGTAPQIDQQVVGVTEDQLTACLKIPALAGSNTAVRINSQSLVEHPAGEMVSRIEGPQLEVGRKCNRTLPVVHEETLVADLFSEILPRREGNFPEVRMLENPL